MGDGSYPQIYLVITLWPFAWSWIQRFLGSRFSFFFFFPGMNSNLIWIHYAWDKITIHALFINIHTLKNIKMGFTVLFTHLKIIFLQYFPFSVFSFSNIKKGKIYWRIKYRFLEVGSTDFWHTCDPGNVGSPGENQER